MGNFLTGSQSKIAKGGVRKVKQKIMNCEDFLSKLNAYIDSELPLAERLAMDEHARSCPECQEVLARALDVATSLAEMDEGLSVPLECQAAWRKAVREEAASRRRPVRGWALRAASIAAAALVLTASVGGLMRLREERDSSRYAANTSATMPSSASYGRSASGYDFDYAEESVSSGAGMLMADGSTDETGRASLAGKSDTQTATETLRILRTANRTIETRQYDVSMRSLTDLVSEHDAYFEENSVSSNQDGVHTAYLTVRVPTAQLDNFLTAIEVLGDVTYRHDLAEDISDRYSESEARLSVLRSQLTRLEAMTAEAQNVEELLSIEQRSSEVIADIEVLEGRLRGWDSQVNYSTVNLTLKEKGEKAQTSLKPLKQRMEEAFESSRAWLTAFWQNALVALAAVAPRLLVWVPALALAIVLVRVIIHHCKKRR